MYSLEAMSTTLIWVKIWKFQPFLIFDSHAVYNCKNVSGIKNSRTVKLKLNSKVHKHLRVFVKYIPFI